MEFVRKIVDGTELRNIIDIPNSLLDSKLEIFVFLVENSKKIKKSKKSLSGFLSKYADSSLISKEENVCLEHIS